jgi:hypothetical protein
MPIIEREVREGAVTNAQKKTVKFLKGDEVVERGLKTFPTCCKVAL